jgi:ABC-2 type transport system permease protein
MKAPPSLEAHEPLRAREPAERVRPNGLGLTALGALYMLTLRQHLHGRRWWILGALFLTPAILAGVVRATAPGAPPILLEFIFVFMFIPQALLPLLALLYASGIIRDEQEEQTFTYILVRPISKWAVYLVKVLATLTTTAALTAVFTALTYVVIYVGADAGGENIPLRCLKAVGVHVLAVAAYCCLFALMSLLTRWTLVLGFLYAAFFEGLLANLPFGVRLLTIIYYARIITYRSMDFFMNLGGKDRTDVAAITWRLDVENDPQLLTHPSLNTCLIVLLAASLVFSLMGALLCSRREFYVKTPEGN